MNDDDDLARELDDIEARWERRQARLDGCISIMCILLIVTWIALIIKWLT